MKRWLLSLLILSACAHPSQDSASLSSNDSLVVGKFSKLTFNGIDLTDQDCQLEVTLNVSPQMQNYKKIPIRPGQIFHFSSPSGQHKFSHLACSIGMNRTAYIFELDVQMGPIHRNIHYIGEYSFQLVSPQKAQSSKILALMGFQKKFKGMKALVSATQNEASQSLDQMKKEYPEIWSEAEMRTFKGPLHVEMSSAQKLSVAKLKALSSNSKKK